MNEALAENEQRTKRPDQSESKGKWKSLFQVTGAADWQRLRFVQP
jgi:hypothetical protein